MRTVTESIARQRSWISSKSPPASGRLPTNSSECFQTGGRVSQLTSSSAPVDCSRAKSDFGELFRSDKCGLHVVAGVLNSSRLQSDLLLRIAARDNNVAWFAGTSLDATRVPSHYRIRVRVTVGILFKYAICRNFSHSERHYPSTRLRRSYTLSRRRWHTFCIRSLCRRDTAPSTWQSAMAACVR